MKMFLSALRVRERERERERERKLNKAEGMVLFGVVWVWGRGLVVAIPVFFSVTIGSCCSWEG